MKKSKEKVFFNPFFESAQGTIEYLVIIGIIVVIAIITAGLFTGAVGGSEDNLLSGSQKLAQKNAYPGALITINNIVADSNGSGVVELLNNSGELVTITGIASGGAGNSFSVTMTPGQSANFVLKDLNNCVCGATDKTKTCYFDLNVTSASGLAKSERKSVTVDCVGDTSSSTGNIRTNLKPLFDANYLPVDTNCGYAKITSVVRDSSSNTYITGYLSSNETIPPYHSCRLNFGNGVIINTAAGIGQMFVVKFDSTGAPIWGATPTYASWNYGASVGYSVYAASDGNVYVTGNASCDINFSNSVAVTGQPTGNAYKIFVVKYSPNGSPFWVLQPTTNGGTQYPDLIKATSDGNLVIVSQYTGSNYFGKDIYGSDVNLNDGSNGGIFMLKINPDKNVIWAKSSGNGPYISSGFSATTDSQDNIYVTGFYKSSLDLNIGTGYILSAKSPGVNTEFFLAGFNSSGNPILATRALTAGSYSRGTGIGVDASSNIYVCGYSDSISFDASHSHTVQGRYDPYIVKYNSSGAVQWVNWPTLTNVNIAQICSNLTVDSDGNPYVHYSIDLDANFGGDYNFPNTAGIYLQYVVKYGSDSTLKWAVQQTGTATTPADSGLYVDSSKNIFLGTSQISGYRLGVFKYKQN